MIQNTFLRKKKMEALQNSITELLLATGREGMEELIQHLIDEGFFTAPASTRFHGCYSGGLATHHYGVYTQMLEFFTEGKLDHDTSQGRKPLKLTHDNIAIATLTHDTCKVGAYLGTKYPYKWNTEQPEGHAVLSIERIKKFIELMPIEEMMIRFHMGIYATYEFHEPGSWSSKKDAEYHLRSQVTADEKKKMTPEEKKIDQEKRYGLTLRNAYYHNPACKFMSIADELDTMREKAKDAL